MFGAAWEGVGVDYEEISLKVSLINFQDVWSIFQMEYKIHF